MYGQSFVAAPVASTTIRTARRAATEGRPTRLHAKLRNSRSVLPISCSRNFASAPASI